MRSDDESSEDFLWGEYILANFKPLKSANLGKLFELSGRIKTAWKHVQFDKQQMDPRYLIYSQNTQHANYCLHAWALHEYSLNDEFDHSIDYDWSRVMDVDNLRQLFLDLVYILSKGEIEDKNRYDFCARASSFHLGLFNLYRKFITATFEEFSVQYFAVMGEAICQPSLKYAKYQLSRSEKYLVKSLKMIIDKTIAALNATEYFLYSCHLKSEDKGIVAAFSNVEERDLDLELERNMQKIIISEPDMTTTQSCSHNCNLDLIKNTLNYKECDEFLDCQYMSSSYEIYHLTNSSRRYSYFIGDDRTEYGDIERYSNEDLRKSQVSRTYNSGGFNWCDYCICTCVKKQPSSSSHSVTALSFRPQLSDIEKNRAVTGLKFVKKNHMILIQIIEGQILPHGNVENVSWRSLEEFEYQETSRKFYVVNKVGSKVPLKEGVDYGHPQTMNLNDVMAPEKHVITGVRFRFAGDSLDSPKLKGGPIELQIRVTPLDFAKGQLININQSVWISPAEKVLKDELVLQYPDNPLYPPEGVEPMITSDKFVKFQASDLKKDAGQSTVPFFDGRELTFYKSCLLSGAGLIHRGHSGSGGHIAIKIFDFNMSPYFNAID